MAAAPAAGATLRPVGVGPEPVQAEREHFAAFSVTPSDLAVWSDRGPVREHGIPPGCTPRRLRFPRLLLACADPIRAERPVVLDVVSGRRQAPPLPDVDPAYVDSFDVAGRTWLAGGRTFTGSGGVMPLLLHRYDGRTVEYKGTPDLDLPGPRIQPQKGEPAPCGPTLTTVGGRPGLVGIRTLDCEIGRVVAACPRGCRAVTNGGAFGAFVSGKRLLVVAIREGRVVGSWPLPPATGEEIVIALTRRHVFVSVGGGVSWRTYEAAL